MTVYVIDDHPLMRDALTMLVQRVRPGLKVVSVPKLSSLESTVERQGEPELICLDLKLPDTLGLSGVHAVKAKFPNVPLVVVTGSEASECEAACLEAGANLFLEKASAPNTIIEGLRTFLPTPEEEMADKLVKMGIPKTAIFETKLITPAKAEKLTWEKRDGDIRWRTKIRTNQRNILVPC